MDSNILDEWCQTPFWDSNLTWYTNNPDFTQCFQTTVLVWVPCSILWLNFFAELYRGSKWKIQRSFSWSKLSVTKMVLLLGLAITSLLKLVYEIYFGRGGSLFYFSQACLTGTYLLAMLLLLYERSPSSFSTGMQFLFWLISAVAGTIAYRSFLMRMNSKFLFDDFVRSLTLETSLYSLTILMFILSFVSDNRLTDNSDGNKNLDGNQTHLSPEDTASLPSRILHSWLTGTIWKAWKNHTTTTDVFEMSLSDRTLARSKIFEKYWSFQKPNKSLKSESEQDAFLSESKKSNSRTQHKSIIPALLKTIRTNLIVGIITQIFTDLISFTSPVILRWLLEFASNDEPLWKGIFYAFLLAVAGVLQSLFIEATALSFNKMVIWLKSITIYAMYKKTLRMSNSERNRLTIGKILNTMYVDTERFSQITMHIGTMITGPISIIFGFYLMYRELGVAALAGLFTAVTSIPITLWITKVRNLKEVEYKRIEDQRIKMTNEILSGVRVLKLYAWESSFENIVNEIRKREIVFKRSWGLLVAVLNITWYTTPILVALLTFSTYVLIDENNIMTTAAAFVTLQIITIMIEPITKLSLAIFYLSTLKICINRMDSILNSDEMEEYVQSGSNNEQFAIQMQDCTFRWRNELEPTLSNINISVPKGSLIAVVGPIGCGKSSLLSSLVCEMLKDNGHAYTTGSLGYLTQQPWIQNTSFRENILFTAPMDEIWYREVIEACALEFDLVNLPGYDETEIGERGINLSGGQKQRVSLARAVYRLYDIYLLDDPLGAVDSHVAKHIFAKVIGPNGLLKNKTRLLVTHNVSFLRDVDEIYFMQNGNIIEKGSFERIMSNKGIAGNYLTQHMKEENHEVVEDSSLPKKNLEKRSNNNLAKNCLIESEERNVDSKSAKLITKENLKSGSASWAVYGRYFREVGKLWSVFCLISCVCFQALTVYSSYWLILWSQDFKPDDDGAMAERNFRLWIYSLISLGQILLLSLTFVAIFVGCLNASKALHFKMLRSIMRSPISFFDTTPIGRIINRFSQDLNMMDTIMCITVKNCLILVVSTLAFLIATIVAIPIFILPIITVIIVFAIIQHILLFTNGQLRRSKLTRDSFLYAHISAALAGTTVIRVCGLAENFQAQFRKLLDDRNSTNYLRTIAERWLNVRINILGNFLLFCSALFSVFGKGKISPGIVGFVMTNSTVLIQNAKNIIQRTTELGTYILSAERVQEYCELESEAEWEKPEMNLPPDWPQRGQIIFRNYSAKYREGLDLVLKDINLKIEGGQKVGVVGRTGAGKSSLTLALFRLIVGVSGEIEVDGVDIAQLGLREARSRLTIIPQEPVLLSGTLRLNLDPFQKHSDHLLHSALKHAHLDAFLQSLPEGLDHPIHEGGQNLSVGQRQLVCLARALLRETRILILDEATASVDLDTDDLIQATIRKKFASSTVITIAHRISTIMDYDKIIVLDQGRVLEFDSPKNLLNNNQSSFYSLVKDANCI